MSENVALQIKERCRCQSFDGCEQFDDYHYQLQRLRTRLYPVIGHDNFELILNSGARKLTVIVHDGEEIDRCIVELA